MNATIVPSLITDMVELPVLREVHSESRETESWVLLSLLY